MTTDDKMAPIACGRDPLPEVDLNKENDKQLLANAEQARLRSVAAYSKSPLYRARAEKDPEYWTQFYVGHGKWSGSDD